MIKLHVLEEPSAFLSLEVEWYELLARSDSNGPTLTPMWLMTWWRVFGGTGGRVLRVCVVRDGQALIGIVPLLARNYSYRRLVRFRRLELLASGEDQADEVLSEYIGPIVARGCEGMVADAVALALANGHLGAWDELVCPRMGAWLASVVELERALTERGAAVSLRQNGDCSYVRLPSTYNAYLDSLPKKHRYSVRHALRELDNWAGKDQKLEICDSPEELVRGTKILSSLHTERWNAEGRAGVFASERFRQFHELIMPQLLNGGALQLVWLTARGAPIAALYNIVWRGTVYVYQSGRSINVPNQVRPGIALHALLIRQAIERGLTEYDFLAGDTLYKAQLGTHTRKLIELRATPHSSLREGARRLAETGIDVMRTLSGKLRVRAAAIQRGEGDGGRD